MDPRAFGLTVAGCLMVAGLSRADVTSVRQVQIDPGDALSGYMTNDISVDFEGILGGQQMVLELTQGSIFQQAEFGNDTAPMELAIDLAADTAFDSFVTIGGSHAEESAGVLVVGGAANLPHSLDHRRGSPLPAKFDTDGLNITWAPSPGTYIPSRTNFMTAQITLSDDAQGVFRYFGSTLADSTTADWIGEASILGGVIGQLERLPPLDSVSRPVPVALPSDEEPTLLPELGETDSVDDAIATGAEQIVQPNVDAPLLDPANKLDFWIFPAGLDAVACCFSELVTPRTSDFLTQFPLLDRGTSATMLDYLIVRGAEGGALSESLLAARFSLGTRVATDVGLALGEIRELWFQESQSLATSLESSPMASSSSSTLPEPSPPILVGLALCGFWGFAARQFYPGPQSQLGER